MPEDVKKCEAHEEKHYQFLNCQTLNVSEDTIRRVFADEPESPPLLHAVVAEIGVVAIQPV
jgi:hypothetical protein